MKKSSTITMNTENDDPLGMLYSDLLECQLKRRKRFKWVMVALFVTSIAGGWFLSSVIHSCI